MAKAAQEEEVQSAIKVGVESGAERLMADIEKEMAEKDASMLESTQKVLEQVPNYIFVG